MSTALSHSPSPSSTSKRSGPMGSLHSGVPGSPSGLAKHTVLPPITPSTSKGVTSREESTRNPFVMPPASEIFTLRERERQKMKEGRARERQLKVHEKSTYASRLNAKTASLRKHALTPDHPPGEGGDKETSIHEDTQFVLATTRDRHIEKEDLASYVARKREMFLVQYALGVKRDEIRKLEDIARAEEKKLEAAEKYLEESATMFDEFLKENDKNAVEAIKMAEVAAKSKLEKVGDIKRLNTQLMAIKNEISRNDDQLTELKMYKEFLDALAPQEWREQREAAKVQKKKKVPLVVGPHGDGEQGASGEDDPSSEEEEDAEQFFSDPRQLVTIFTELEEQNLSLIQNSQETEETLEDMRQNSSATQQKMNRETESLKRQIEVLRAAIGHEEERANDLEMKSKMFSYGEYKAEDQEHMLTALDKKVADVYSKCIGANEANIPTLQMLTAIEGRLEDLFETIESLPADKVEAAEKAKDKERRMRMREEKLEEQRLHQEERLRKALERAQADPKKRMGRKLVYRSEPPVMKRKQKEKDEMKDKEEEELQYFFS